MHLKGIVYMSSGEFVRIFLPDLADVIDFTNLRKTLLDNATAKQHYMPGI